MFARSVVYTSFVAVVLLYAVNTCPAREQKVVQGKPIPAQVATIQMPNATVRAVIEALAKQTGLEVDITAIDGNKPVRADFNKTEFWKVVDAVAEQSGSQVVIGKLGKAVRLEPAGKGNKSIISVDGPFRIAAREIEALRDLITGNTIYDLTLEIAWEPRLPVFRIDSTPQIDMGRDDGGKPITVKPVATRVAVDGSFSHARVRLEGINRDSKQIAMLKGSYRVTTAEEMLRCQFDDLVKLPATVKQNGVEVQLKQLAKNGSIWIADMELHYPPGGPIFESFETFWLSRNRIALVSPQGKKIVTEDEEIDGHSIRYRFKETADFKPANLKGWKLEYETTGVMREAPVKFELKGILLP